jgi:hypothetical protein
VLTRNVNAEWINRVGSITLTQFEALGTMNSMNKDTQQFPDQKQTSDSQQNQPSLAQAMVRCDTGNCGRPAMCSLELKHVCVDHFIARCYERLNECSANRFADPDEAAAVSIDRFLLSSAQQAAGLVHPMRGLDNLERARLFDILLWASELAAKRGIACPTKRSAQSSGS